jgi:hypothetical protein
MKSFVVEGQFQRSNYLISLLVHCLRKEEGKLGISARLQFKHKDHHGLCFN